ncbi:MAG TPA: hypothetical protein VEQ62_04315 [Stellaceae bacterium]|nr:hypothetical protein [Stellaceae bacterium]
MATSAIVGGLVREVLVEDSTDQAIVGGVVREVLVKDAADKAIVGGVVREVLLVDQPDLWVLVPRWARRMAWLEEPENDPDFEALALVRHRRQVAKVPFPKRLRTYISINT